MSKLLVMMSVYNGQEYIEAQIKSIMEQKTSHEILLRIRDDGSKDNSRQVIESLIDKYPGRIELVVGENIGSNASFFKLIDLAEKYDYYAISDQDDVFLPEKYEIACNRLAKEDNSIPLLFSATSYLVKNDMIPFGETRKKERELTIYNTVIQNICPGHNQVFNNALLSLLKKINSPSKIYVYDMWIANIAMLYGKIIFLNYPVTYYRQHDRNLMGAKKGKVGKLIMSYRRLIAGDGKRTREQLKYFLKENKEKLEQEGYFEEINAFLNAKTVSQRIKYVSHSKLYRQSYLETVAFKLAVIVGRY